MSENIQAALLSLPMELARIQTELQAGLQQFHNGQVLDAARPVDLARRPLVWGGECRLVGWSVRAIGAGSVTATLRNGRDDSAELVAVLDVNSTSKPTSHAWFGGAGVAVTDALWLQTELAGGTPTLAGVVYLGTVD